MKRIAIILASFLVAAGIADARKVTGCVHSGEEMLSGVIVTDGENFTQTKKNGKFSFDIKDDADFVFIITPSGYTADWSTGVPAYYREAEGCSKFDFDLIKTGDGVNYNILGIGDIQTKTDEHHAIFAADPIDDLTQTGKILKGQTVGLALGDTCWDVLEFFDKYKKAIVRTGVPVYPIIGNHDHDRYAKGDYETGAKFREEMGPENYAFFLGKDIVIVVDNIIYKTNKKYDEGYADHVLAWVKNIMKFVPQDADVYVAQHSTLKKEFLDTPIINANLMLDLVRGHKTIFITGHSHICLNANFGDNIVEHNVAALCGSWWDTYYCTDGTPKGYKVYTKQDGRLEWYYKPVGRSKDYQVEVFKPGQAPMHPNSVIVNVWDYDKEWKVEWFEDGKPMGKMEQVEELSPYYIKELYAAFKGRYNEIKPYKFPRHNVHYFAATPSQYAKTVTVAVESRFGQKWVHTVNMSDYIDVQGHRGGMGLMPENTIEAMKNALDMGINTLELDLQLSKDGVVVVSHDAYFHPRYATRPDGSEVKKGDPKEYLFTKTYEEIAKYDVGSKANPDWPERTCVPTRKPTLDELIDFVEGYTKKMGYSPVRYNIEVKSKVGDGEGINWPIYHDLADACAKVLISKHLDDRLVVQCFDHRTLNFMKEKYPELKYSYLIDQKCTDFEAAMAKLKFVPEWLSPHYTIVDEQLVKKCREKGMKIVPWTPDKPEDIQRMVDLGVDAIITNYPDRLLMITRGYAAPAPGPFPHR